MMGAFQIGKRFDVVEVIASNYGDGLFTVGSHRIAEKDGMGFQVITDGNKGNNTWCKTLYLTTTDFIDNNKCKKVGALIITRLK